MSEYAGWPTLAELRRVLDVDPNSTTHDVTLQRVLDSAIEETKNRVGTWDDLLDDPPNAKLAQHALRMAELLALRPESAVTTITDPTLDRLIAGNRRRFAIS